MQELANLITKTIDDYHVKNLKWDSISNIYIGHVKCPIMGREELHEGYISATWRANGFYIDKGKGKRPDLKLNLPK